MAHVCTSIEDVTPAWLTAVLQRHGQHVHSVQHIHVTHTHDEQLHSISYRFEAQWSPSAPATLPTRFFLKLPRHRDTEGIASAGAREVAMYRFLATHQPALPTLPCYDAMYDAQQQRYHLLLADLTHSHDQPRWHLAIDEGYVQRTVDCLAQLHAYWWGRTARCWAIATRPTSQQVAADVQHIRDTLPHFSGAVGAQLTAEEHQLYARLVSAAAQLWARRLDPHHPTLVHGDAHFWNFLYPHSDTTLPTYILDWQQQHIDWGVSDLAYMLVLRYPHRTQANEYTFVQRYHAALVEHGVTNYLWDTCWHDYRRAVVEQMLIPIQWYTAGVPEALWQLFVPRSLMAYRDLNCEEFLDQ
jgi:hypothetical protein